MRGRWHVCYGSGLSIIYILYYIYIYRLPFNGAMIDSHIFSSALSKLVEEVWEESSGAGQSKERQSSEGWSRERMFSVKCSRAVQELTGLMRRTVENTTRTLCQV